MRVQQRWDTIGGKLFKIFIANNTLEALSLWSIEKFNNLWDLSIFNRGWGNSLNTQTIILLVGSRSFGRSV